MRDTSRTISEIEISLSCAHSYTTLKLTNRTDMTKIDQYFPKFNALHNATWVGVCQQYPLCQTQTCYSMALVNFSAFVKYVRP